MNAKSWGAAPAEVIASFPVPPARPTPVVRVRSTVVASGLVALRERDLIGRYYELLPREHHGAIAAIIAGHWLPISLVMAHYDACERLTLTYDEALAIGLNVGSRIHDSLLLNVKRLALAAGVTPWTALAQYDRLWRRTFDGGGFVVTRAGPKDAIIHISQMPLARYAYFRASYCGVTLGGVRLFAQTAYVRPLPGTVSDHGFSFRAAWA